MGIPDLWKEIGGGDVEALADIATNHWRTHNRPFRLAIDEAGWLFNNLTPFQVEKVREKSDPRANPIEKAILWRVLDLLRLGIQPVFLSDGPSRPRKHGSGAGKIDYNRTRLLRKLLTVLRIRYHEAPGEAEAECARFHEQGIVDAVWSDDGDTLMFGASVLIRSYKDEKSSAAKSKTHVRVYRADKIKQNFGLDRHSLVLFSLLAGGDYDGKGLEGCGSNTAFKAVRWQDGRLGKMLATADLKHLSPFTQELANYFQQSRNRVHVPHDFPRALHVGHYRDPKVTEGFDRMQKQAEKLTKHWDAEIDEAKLRNFLRETFDIQTKEYIRNIVPVLLVNRMIKTTTIDVEARKQLDIKLVHKRGKTAEHYKVERLLTFNPLACSKLDLRTLPQDLEDWTRHTNKKTGEKWDPGERIEIEMLDIFLERGLGAVEMVRLKEEASKPKSHKRKIAAGGDGSGNADGDGRVEQAAEPSVPVAKRRKSDKVSPTDPGTDTQSEAGRANTKRKRQSKKDAIQARQGGSPELGESPPQVHNPSTRTGGVKPSITKRKSIALGEEEVVKEREAAKPQTAVFHAPTAILNLTVERRKELRREGVQVWHANDAGQEPLTSTKPAVAFKPRYAPPPPGFDKVIRTEPVPLNGSDQVPFSDLVSARSNAIVIVSSPPLPSSTTGRSRVVVPKPALATRVDSGTEIFDLCSDEQDGIPSGLIRSALSLQQRKDQRVAEYEAELRKIITEHELKHGRNKFDETIRKTVHQKLDQCRTSLLKLLGREAVETIDTLNDILAPGGLSTTPQQREVVYDQVLQFRTTLERHLEVLGGNFSEACALENVFHGDGGNMTSASPPSLTDPTGKADLAVMKFALGVDTDLAFNIPRLGISSNGPRASPGQSWSAISLPGADDVDKMSDKTPSKFSRIIGSKSASGPAEASVSRSHGDVLMQGDDTTMGDPLNGDVISTEVMQRSTRSNGSAGLVKPNNWARFVEHSPIRQASIEPAATSSTLAQNSPISNTTDRKKVLDRVYSTTSPQGHEHNQDSTLTSISTAPQAVIYNMVDDDSDEECEDDEDGQFNDHDIEEALRRSKQDALAAGYSSTFASCSRAAYSGFTSTSKAGHTDLSESPYPASVEHHDSTCASAEHEQRLPYTGKGKALMYPSPHSMAAPANDIAGALRRQLEQEKSSASTSARPSTSNPAETFSASLPRSPTAPPGPTWACINKPRMPPRAPASNADTLPSLSTSPKNGPPALSAVGLTPIKGPEAVLNTIPKQATVPRPPPVTTDAGKATGGKTREDIAAARVAHFKDVIKNTLPSALVAPEASNAQARKGVVQPREVIDLCEETTEEKAAAARKKQMDKERRRKENKASHDNAVKLGKGVFIDLTLD